jgi:hypothetical protein
MGAAVNTIHNRAPKKHCFFGALCIELGVVGLLCVLLLQPLRNSVR